MDRQLVLWNLFMLKKENGRFFFDCWIMMRPFTLIAPALGIISGGLVAWGAEPHFAHLWPGTTIWIYKLLIAAVGASLLNGASNICNQIYDLEIDRLNKPDRLLLSTHLSCRHAYAVALISAFLAFAAAAIVHWHCFLLFLAAAFFCILYTIPPFRLKRFGWVANMTIAIPRGMLLLVAGWSTTRSVASVEPWMLGAFLGLFLAGATASKDFNDIEGDRFAGCSTLPVRYGRRRAVRYMYPFYTIPFLLFPLASLAGLIGGHFWILLLLGVGNALWGHSAAMTLNQTDQDSSRENHRGWYHMYMMMFTTQFALVLAYLI